MKISKLLTDTAILQELGKRFAQTRIQHGYSQAQLAEEAGISKRTIERLEDGASTQLSNWIRVLRTLDLIHGLESAIPEQSPGPMELLTQQGQIKRRKRVSRKRTSITSTDKTPTKSSSTWKWKDEV